MDFYSSLTAHQIRIFLLAYLVPHPVADNHNIPVFQAQLNNLYSVLRLQNVDNAGCVQPLKHRNPVAPYHYLVYYALTYLLL